MLKNVVFLVRFTGKIPPEVSGEQKTGWVDVYQGLNTIYMQGKIYNILAFTLKILFGD